MMLALWSRASKLIRVSPDGVSVTAAKEASITTLACQAERFVLHNFQVSHAA